MENFHGFDDDMFTGSQKIDFHSFKNGDHKFRVLPPFEKGKLFLQVDLHWGFTDENGRKKALKCTKWTHKQCAICDEVDRLKGEIEQLKASPAATQQQKDELTALTETKEKRVSDIKKKATYLWNILTEEGAQKVLQLSWNGHDPLHQKVKFFWEQKKINVTDPRNNYLMWVSRTGLNAKTRYAYEVLEQNVRALENLKPLIDLSKVYKETTPAELKAVVEQGFVGLAESDPNDRDFSADMPTMDQMTNTTATPAPQTQTPIEKEFKETSPQTSQTPVYTEPLPVEPSPTLNTNLQGAVEDETERLMKMMQE